MSFLICVFLPPSKMSCLFCLSLSFSNKSQLTISLSPSTILLVFSQPPKKSFSIFSPSAPKNYSYFPLPPLPKSIPVCALSLFYPKFKSIFILFFWNSTVFLPHFISKRSINVDPPPSSTIHPPLTLKIQFYSFLVPLPLKTWSLLSPFHLSFLSLTLSILVTLSLSKNSFLLSLSLYKFIPLFTQFHSLPPTLSLVITHSNLLSHFFTPLPLHPPSPSPSLHLFPHHSRPYPPLLSFFPPQKFSSVHSFFSLF